MPAFEGTETVLVVDDKSFIVSLAHEMLTTYGYRALAVNSAAEAIHLFESSPNLDVDLALLDIVMPEMTGTDLALRLKQIRPSLPIVFMSAYSESPVLRPERYGKINFIAKPFSPLALARKIREVLDAQRADSRSTSGLS